VPSLGQDSQPGRHLAEIVQMIAVRVPPSCERSLYLGVEAPTSSRQF